MVVDLGLLLKKKEQSLRISAERMLNRMIVPRKQNEGNGGENYVTQFFSIIRVIKTGMKRSTHAGGNKCSIKVQTTVHTYSKYAGYDTG